MGYGQEAATLTRGITETVGCEGLREFYNSYDGRGMGAREFAWSALAPGLFDPSNASAGVPIHAAIAAVLLHAATGVVVVAVGGVDSEIKLRRQTW